MAQYDYKPLAGDGNEIRLLRLLPGQTSDDIHIEMFHAPFHLEDVPDYEALSYVWGSTEIKRNILVQIPKSKGATGPNDIRTRSTYRDWSRRAELQEICTLAVTQNLDVALRHLRWSWKTRVLWIDAICINQADLPERGVEVARMGAIYSGASQVIVWLGPESEDSTLAVETLEAIGDDVRYDEDKRLVTTIYDSATALLEDDERLLSAKEEEWVAVTNLIEREWFRRLWTVQEIKLATKAVLCVGSCSLSWHTFKVAFQWVWTYAKIFLSGFDVIDYLRIDFILRRSVEFPVLFLVEYANHSICSDPRDRVFAILSLLRPSLRKDFGPNYMLTPEEVYRNFTLHVIKHEERVEILRLCATRSATWSSSLPSWVPNLSIPSPVSHFGRSSAAGCSKHEAEGQFDDGKLRIRGVHVTTVNFVGSAVPPGAKLAEILAVCHSWEPKHVDNDLYKGGGTLLDAYICTLIAGCTRDNAPAEIGMFPSIEDGRSFLRNCIRGGRVENLPEGHQLYVNRLLLALRGRALFTTLDGYIGLCQADAKPGDKACVVLGCLTPLLLRPISNSDAHYHMFGECYIHGLMQCEGLFGPLPSLWERKSTSNSGYEFDVWEYDGEITHEDPRLGALPSGWRRRYMDADSKPVNYPFDDEGNPRPSGFEDIESGSRTWADPRLTSGALIARGVDIQEFVLV